jgi:hypothetical protein
MPQLFHTLHSPYLAYDQYILAAESLTEYGVLYACKIRKSGSYTLLSDLGALAILQASFGRQSHRIVICPTERNRVLGNAVLRLVSSLVQLAVRLVRHTSNLV